MTEFTEATTTNTKDTKADSVTIVKTGFLSSNSSFSALLPLGLFFLIFIGSGVYLTLQGQEYAFYQVSATVAILPAIILAIWLGKRRNVTLQQSINVFLEGVRNPNIIVMCLIYLLAGAFAKVSQDIGAVSSTVNLTLHFIPAEVTLPALFLVSSLVSLAMGTSMGTIAAVGPIGVGIAGALGLSLPLTMGAIVGGAMFGDNLSIISDTSIAATQIHGCTAKEKFKNNILLAFPAMMITMIILSIFALKTPVNGEFAVNDYQIIHSLPYLLILGLALSGVNVFVVLIAGIVSAGLIGFLTVDSYSFVALSKNIFEGYKEMFEIMVLSLFIGGLGELIKQQGGFNALTLWLEKLFQSKQNERSPRSAETSIGAIVSVSDICTANNTAAIILSGDATKEIAVRNKLSPSRVATLVDLFSCVFQGILPYSAQILMAGTLSEISPMSIIPYVHYCYILGIFGIGAIILQRPK